MTTTPAPPAHRARLRACRAVAGVLLGIVGLSTLFVVGETFDDPGGWAAVGLVALWVVPLTALIGLAAWRPDVAVRVDAVVATVAGVGIVLGGLDLGVGALLWALAPRPVA